MDADQVDGRVWRVDGGMESGPPHLVERRACVVDLYGLQVVGEVDDLFGGGERPTVAGVVWHVSQRDPFGPSAGLLDVEPRQADVASSAPATLRIGTFNIHGGRGTDGRFDLDDVDDTFIDIAAGERALEPVQLAVRAGVERAVVQVMSRFYRVNDSEVCEAALMAEGDPMGPGQPTPGVSQTSAAIDNARPTTDAWHVSRDENITGIRGRS